MKNKLGDNFLPSETFIGDLPVSATGQQPRQKFQVGQESAIPKIVICPPMEDMPEQTMIRRGRRLLRVLTNQLSKRTTDSDSEGSSGSSDNVSSEPSRRDDRTSCSVSESSSEGSVHHRRNRSVLSLRRVFQTLNISSRSQSCSPQERSRTQKKQPQPKRILRPPVTYTYVRGLSGLPTQRVPRHRVCAPLGLNR